MTNINLKIKRFGTFILVTESAKNEEINKFLQNEYNELLSDDWTGLEYDKHNAKYIIYEWLTYELIAIDEFPFNENDFFYKGKWNRPSNTATLKLENFVGTIKFRNHFFSVHSQKLPYEKVNELVNYIDKKITSLSLRFSSNSISNRTFTREIKSKNDFNQFIFLYNLLKSKILINNINLVLRNPYKTFQNNSNTVEFYGATQFSNEDLIEIFSGNNVLKKSKSNLPLVKKLKGFIPEKINQHENITSIDNNENQFVLFFLKNCINLLTKTIKELELNINKNKIINQDFIVELKGYRTELSRKVEFFNYVGRLTTINKSSTVLTKRAGYKELYNYYLNMKSNPINVVDEESFIELFENKSIDKLYEYVALFYLDEYLQTYYIQGTHKKTLGTHSNNYAVTLDERNNKIKFKYSKEGYPTATLFFQRNYTRNENTSYAITQAPDFSLFIEYNGKCSLYHFDTKFKIKLFDNNHNNHTKQYAKEEDLKSMHAYRDGIKDTKGAYVLYPGNKHSKITIYSANENKFNEENLLFNKNEGIGSIPLQINENNQQLRDFIKELIEWHKKND